MTVEAAVRSMIESERPLALLSKKLSAVAA